MTRQCEAKSKQSGARCRRSASPGRNVCALHGGRSPVGIASPSFRTGVYSKLPEAIHERYLQVKADPNFLSVSDELAALRAIAAELAGGLGEDVVAVRRDVGSAFDDLQVAKVSRKPDRLREAMVKLEQVIENARQTSTKLDELVALFDGVRKLADSETKRIVLAKEMLTREQSQHFGGLVQQALMQAVDTLNDPDDRRRVLGAFTDNMIRIQAGGLR